MGNVAARQRSTIDIAGAVLGAARRERAGRLPAACFAALAAHALLLLGVRHTGLGASSFMQPIEPAEMEPSPAYQVDVEDPPPAPQRAAPASVPVERHAMPPRARELAPARARSPAAEAAQAASIVAQEPDPAVPVDLTADAMVTGRATAYAGGATTSTGAGSSAVREMPSAAEQGEPRPRAAPDRSSPVSLESESWSCPWPHEAEAQQIDEQIVVLRVVVDGMGAPQRATVVTDPGHGFGPAAAACAMRTRFTPGRDHDGRPTRATSPPIRVRFTR